MLAELKKPQEADLTTYIESLNYAQIIQRGLLPKKRHFKRLFEDYFVIYKRLHRSWCSWSITFCIGFKYIGIFYHE
jgi:hypothetical protein